MNTRTIRSLVLAVAIALGTIGVVVAIDSSTDEQGHTHRSVTIRLGGHADAPAGVPAGPATLTLAPPAAAALDKVRDNKPGELGENLKDETPAGVDPNAL